MMYKVANENVAITKHNRLSPLLGKSRNMHEVWCHVCHRVWCQGMCQVDESVSAISCSLVENINGTLLASMDY